ncbi:hypothetical protein Glo7428_3418 [Gloeocapsa sp. PCC 7428]|uniref:hypothetical protein n=1 Tax=Gloeocapsa sp. PCC 7428 TaxID=1173026 RepID=UPI0002A5C56A|nr:hypothetical protein [Gloeocapsa sp. PCC 7428]AFZ31897.1 hypothetical protein Glo7428_3418 [Gloeocapsa sp. PCC 7428]
MQSIDNYLSAWNATTSNERYSFLINCLATDVIYLDPHIPNPVQGIEEMQALIERFRTLFDHILEPEGDVDMHHNVFRLQWRLQRSNGEILSHGLMIGDLSATGMIERIIHFVDSAP